MDSFFDVGNQSRYRNFLLTCWQERDFIAGTIQWRYGVESLQTGRRRVYAYFSQMMAAIEDELQVGNQDDLDKIK